ncbi:MAG: hypothetical protein LBK25_06970 [Treponema sp.]|jgi:hypothetical protein|nr:hypothetical protein [Treponema sp.]
MKVRAETPVIFTGITIGDSSAVYSANAHTVTLTPTFEGKNIPSPTPTVMWNATDGTTAASISNGVLSIPAGVAVGTVFTVTASAVINGVTHTDSATVTILAEAPKVTALAVTATSGLDSNDEASAGGTVVFTAAVTGDVGVSKAVTWAVKTGAENAASTYTTIAGDTSVNPTLTLTI